MVKVNIKRLNGKATIPTKGSRYSAGYDLYANIDFPTTIQPNETVKIGTGLSIEIPNGYFGAVMARSGLATKQGLAPANKVGVCDSDYRGEYIVALHNHSDKPRIIEPNERVAQLIIIPYLSVSFIDVGKLSLTGRGDGGFGSSGNN